jgi:hypothetical protein
MSLDGGFDTSILWVELAPLEQRILRMFFEEPGMPRSSIGSLQLLVGPHGTTSTDIQDAVEVLRDLGYLKVVAWHGMFYAFETPKGMLLTWKSLDAVGFSAAVRRVRDALPRDGRFSSVKTVADTAGTPLYLANALVSHWRSQGLLRFDNACALAFARIDDVRQEIFALEPSTADKYAYSEAQSALTPSRTTRHCPASPVIS